MSPSLPIGQAQTVVVLSVILVETVSVIILTLVTTVNVIYPLQRAPKE